jgi:16S rRNA (uracil1498-N3)-methyltransferase
MEALFNRVQMYYFNGVKDTLLMELFYAEKIDNDVATFNADERQHIVRSYRKREGDPISFTIGDGILHSGRITKLEKHLITASVLSSEPQAKVWNGRLHLAVAPTKNFNRIEWMIEKMVELGIDEITPIITERSERKTWKQDRLLRIILAASKQSLKCKLPQVNQPLSFDSFIQNFKDQGTHYFGHCDTGEKTSINDINFTDKNVCFSIGPEGDFSPKEITLAQQNGFQAISLGQQRLRTETAALKMGVAFHIYNDWE